MANPHTIQKIHDLFAEAGITINGHEDWDIQIKHHAFYDRLIRDGSMGFGESYMDGWWECKDLEEMLWRIFHYGIHEKYKSIISVRTIFDLTKARLTAAKDPYEIGRKHYDTGNDLFERMLGKSMAYSCGYWNEANSLDEAQEAKYELICKKLQLEPKMSVIDIGCGWGGLLAYMVEKYQVRAVGLTVAAEQKKYIDEVHSKLNIETHLMDYREFCKVNQEQFDRVVSVGMFEHVGLDNYLAFMESCYQLLSDDGLFLLHTIGNQISDNSKDEWLDTYIFPNGKIPSLVQLAAPTEGLFVMEDWHNFGLDYEKTLLAWFENFDSTWDQIKDRYGERFYRMWKLYLLGCAARFRSRHLHLWQIVFSKGRPETYRGVR